MKLDDREDSGLVGVGLPYLLVVALSGPGGSFGTRFEGKETHLVWGMIAVGGSGFGLFGNSWTSAGGYSAALRTLNRISTSTGTI